MVLGYTKVVPSSRTSPWMKGMGALNESSVILEVRRLRDYTHILPSSVNFEGASGMISPSMVTPHTLEESASKKRRIERLVSQPVPVSHKSLYLQQAPQRHCKEPRSLLCACTRKDRMLSHSRTARPSRCRRCHSRAHRRRRQKLLNRTRRSARGFITSKNHL